MKGQVVWITGASSGIGEALARLCAERGARVVISARRAERLEALRASCPDPSRVHVAPMDVSDTASIPDVVRGVLSRVGNVDFMVHNAGIVHRSRVAETTLDVDRRVMEVNYFGVVALTKSLLPSMLARRGGRFVVVSSVTGYVGTPLRSAYAASKHALHGFFESLRAEVSRDGVGITMVCPGFVETEITQQALRGDGRAENVTGERAKGISPERCARAIADGMSAGKHEVIVGGPEVAAIYARRFAPRLLAAALARFRPT